ncbi:MAG: TolC family protein [Pseudomonadota bacterium]
MLSSKHAPLLLALVMGVQFPFSTPVFSQAAEAPGYDVIGVSPELSLGALLQSALARDPRTAESQDFRRQGQAWAGQARRVYAGQPALSMRHQTDTLGSDRGLREWEAGLEIPLWRYGERQAVRDLAAGFEDYAGAREAALRLSVAGEVRESLWGLLLAEEQLRLAAQALETAQALEREVEIREQAGDLALKDRLLARDELLAKQDEHLAARIALRHAVERYEYLTGLSQRPADSREVRSTISAITDDHPQLREIKMRLATAVAEVNRLKQGTGEPVQLTVGVRQERAAVGEESQTSAGLGVRLPLEGKRYRAADLAAAELQVTQIRAEQGRVQRELMLTAHEAEHVLSMMEESLRLAEEQAKVGGESLRLARLAFEAGDLELSQLLRIQSQAMAAERRLTLRRLEQQQAIARYNQAVGVLP